MIVCEHSKVEFTENGWSIKIPPKVGGVIGVFPGQTLFGYIEPETGRLLLSPLRLTSTVSYFRMFLDDVRGSLADVTELFSKRGLNILTGGAFGFSNIWVSEFLVDFADSGVSPDEIMAEISDMGGFVTGREITELFPVSFNLSATYMVEADEGDWVRVVSDEPAEAQVKRAKYAVVKAWPRIRAMFIDFFPPDSGLVHISARIKDVPGSLKTLTEVIGAQVNLNALDELHHDEVSGVWNAYGELVMGELGDLVAKARQLDTVAEFEATQLN
jgi:hypothetical protein